MTHSATILIVDDEQSYLDMIANTLRIKNYKVLQALNGRMGCKVAEKFLPDIIVMDWEMPEMSGIQAIEYLKEQPTTRDIPIIMATGAMTSVENLETALTAGAIDYIRKPIEVLEIVARINAALKLSRSYQEIKAQKDSLIELNDRLNVAYKEIKESNRNITDSLLYAKRIQDALLPFDELFKKSFQDYFIFFKPRDIVSGDFYWMDEKNYADGGSKLIFAVIDCTGHGVPGAFMSMIANDLMNVAVHDKELKEADLILNELHRGIRKALRQEETFNRDGMDMTLCVIDKQQKKMEFAGAHSPIIFVQENEEPILIKGDRISVGGFQPELERKFTKHTFEIKNDTFFYLFTDGFQDQFGGGVKDKKFMAKRFRELLMELHHLPCHLQKKKLENTLSDWMGKNKQMDDITVLGVRV